MGTGADVSSVVCQVQLALYGAADLFVKAQRWHDCAATYVAATAAFLRDRNRPSGWCHTGRSLLSAILVRIPPPECETRPALPAPPMWACPGSSAGKLELAGARPI